MTHLSMKIKALSLLFLVVALEIGARAYVYFTTPSYVLLMPEVAFSYRPNSVVDEISLNDIGCIGDDVRIGKQTNERRIFILGDAPTFSRSVVDSLRELIRPLKSELKIKVVSCGKPGYTSMHNLINFQRVLSNYNPDLLVVYQAIGENVFNTSPWIDGLPDSEYLDWRSSDSVFLSLVRKHLLRPLFLVNRDFTEAEIVSGKVTAESLRSLIRSARVYRSNVLLVTQSIGYPTEDAALTSIFNRNEGRNSREWGTIASAALGVATSNRMTREVAEFNQISLSETVERIPHTTQYFSGFVTLTEEGAKLWALQVAEKIVKGNLLEHPKPLIPEL